MKTGSRVVLVIVFHAIFGFAAIHPGFGEELRVLLTGSLEVPGSQTAIPLPYNGSALIFLGQDHRFFRGIEIELNAPAEWLSYQGSLAAALYADLEPRPAGPHEAGAAMDLEGRRFLYEPLPGKLQIVYQIPLRPGSGMRSSPYALVPGTHVLSASFPILFRLVPVIKGISEELEMMQFQLSIRPILGDEGAIRISFRFPEQLPGRPFTLLIDDQVVETAGEELLLKEGEHHLLILSDDYRNENRLFLVEKARVLDLSIELQDPTPLMLFEAPENAQIFLDNLPVQGNLTPILVEAGPHEVRFQVSDYSITQNIVVQRGKTYRVAMMVEVDVSESD